MFGHRTRPQTHLWSCAVSVLFSTNKHTHTKGFHSTTRVRSFSFSPQSHFIAHKFKIFLICFKSFFFFFREPTDFSVHGSSIDHMWDSGIRLILIISSLEIRTNMQMLCGHFVLIKNLINKKVRFVDVVISPFGDFCHFPKYAKKKSCEGK